MNEDGEYRDKLIQDIIKVGRRGWGEVDDSFRGFDHQLDRSSTYSSHTPHIHGIDPGEYVKISWEEEGDDFKDVLNEYKAAVKERDEAQEQVDELRDKLVEMWGKEIE